MLENQELVPGEIYNWEELDPGGFRSDGDAILSEYKSHLPKGSKGMRTACAQDMEGPVLCTCNRYYWSLKDSKGIELEQA